MQTRIHATVGALMLLGLTHANAYYEPYGATNDLWDIRQGTVVTAHSPFDPYPGGTYDPRDLFGGTFGANVGLETGAVIFADGQPAGFTHYIEWRTATPVTIGSFKFHASEDMLTP